LHSATRNAPHLALRNPPGGAFPANRPDSPIRRWHATCFVRRSEDSMTDLLLVLTTAAFFGLSWGYARLCEKL
jgi:hypothetical protein